ncbi:unnamed protein product [Periconia digitata]|uniref:Uncharacterized protein n=1 Tax=Periconia digitata TaxID=1303443 RepID=A0A9W4U7J4_9PLEO|nr:unnamed protein product [Periconia digitata]
MLFLMSTANSPTSGRLTPSWVSNLTRRGSKSPSIEDRSSNPGGLLVPGQASRSSDSEGSRSIHSTRSDGSQTRTFIGRISNKFQRKRSPSTAGYDALTPPILGLKDFKAGPFHDWKAAFAKYNQLVTNQVSKDGSGQSKEFADICAELEKQCGGPFIHGLPEPVFDLALLWCPTGAQYRKQHPALHPSWSWTGWEGAGVNFPFDPYNCPDIRQSEGDFLRSEIFYYNLGPSNSPWTVRRLRDQKVRLQVPYHGPFRGNTHPTTETDTLRFAAFTIPAESFKMCQVVDDDKHRMPYSELMDKENRHCGNIMDYRHLISASDDRERKFEYVLLSRSRRCPAKADTTRPSSNVAHPPGTPIWKDDRFLWDEALEDFDDSHFNDSEWCMLNVMLVEYQDEGWWERVAIGQMHEEVWQAQNPTRKDIVLR